MSHAIELAKRGMGFVSPNPMVGAVVVRDGKILGEGWHERYGGLHAERNAIADCLKNGHECEGADLYVTLEPCCHYGKTPPCTEAVIENGFRRVFIGSGDPNPLVAGKGITLLREHGIEVTEGVLSDECRRLNEIFFYYITEKTPFVTMKYAMTLDGKIACHTGLSKWVTGETARERVQYERLRHSAIMVGVGTVLADDPKLTCRLPGGRDPVRIICDSRLRTPADSYIVRTAGRIRTIIACAEGYDTKKADILQKSGCIILPAGSGRTDLRLLMKVLAEEQKIDSVLLEGGAELNWSALESGIVCAVQAYIAPKLFGGNTAKSPVGGIGAESPDKSYLVDDYRTEQLGDDILIEGRVSYVHRDN